MDVDNVHRHGRGTAVLMNLSPQWYNAYRAAGVEQARKRDVFIRHIRSSGISPWVRLKNATDREHGYEITYWSKPESSNSDRTILFVCLNPEISGNSLGGGNAVGLKNAILPVALQFTGEVRNLRDERTGKEYGSGQEFQFDWKQNESLVLSFARH